jgi:hypothetical protein
MSSVSFLSFCQIYFATLRMRTTKSQSSAKVLDASELYALRVDALIYGQNTPVLTIDELEHRNFV